MSQTHTNSVDFVQHLQTFYEKNGQNDNLVQNSYANINAYEM